MTSQYDIIIIGAGHNGLVAAAYLARAGKKVLLLERRAVPGGQLVSETVAKDFTIDAIHAGARLRPDIARELTARACNSTRWPPAPIRSGCCRKGTPHAGPNSWPS